MVLQAFVEENSQVTYFPPFCSEKQKTHFIDRSVESDDGYTTTFCSSKKSFQCSETEMYIGSVKTLEEFELFDPVVIKILKEMFFC